MKVNGYGNVPELFKAYNNQKQSYSAQAKEQEHGKGVDTFELSAQAKEIQELKAALANASEIRDEKVSRLKKEVESGQYKVDARKLAEGILQERLLDKQV